MNHKKFVFIMVILVTVCASALFAEPPYLKDVKISSAVEFDSITGIYSYRYSVFNSPMNNGLISDFQIDISKPLQSAELSDKDFIIQKGIDYQGVMMTRSFAAEVEGKDFLLKKKVIPVGVRVPSRWSGDITVKGTVMWGGSEKNLIIPGQSLNRFVIITHGLPGIREAYAQPDYIATEEEILKSGISEKEYIENTWEVLDKFYKSLTFKTKTIGPTAPPKDFNPLNFLNYIIDLKNQAVSLGWIKNKNVEQSFNAKLDDGQKKLKQGNISAVKEVLNGFIKEVESQGCMSYDTCPADKLLTPEAYALLKYNVQYLIERL
ncbi:MAG: hypothetical protein HY752_03365 [Nitrospirae bacterium]|nr:hypothetical protein [Nitrospirota bacterium]